MSKQPPNGHGSFGHPKWSFKVTFDLRWTPGGFCPRPLASHAVAWHGPTHASREPGLRLGDVMGKKPQKVGVAGGLGALGIGF